MRLIDELLAQVKTLSSELDKRIQRHEVIEPYYEGSCPPPPAITEARLTKAYRYLMPVSEAAWGSLIVDSSLDRLEPSGLTDTDQDAADACWGFWQDNAMDAESKLAHNAALLDGRCHALVWPDPDSGQPEIALDDCTQMIVQYREGSRRKRVAALRRWKSDGKAYATLYLRDGVYKFQAKSGGGDTSSPSDWEKREVDGEPWPLANPLDEIPVVELGVNRRLKPGAFTFTRGEFEHCRGMIDRINLLTFLGLVVAFWMGFPLRVVIGYKPILNILKDDDGNPIIDTETGKERVKAEAPFDVHADSLGTLPNPESRIDQFDAADRSNLSIYDELAQLATLTKTPRHYFPYSGGLSNIAADAIRADEGALHAKVTGHKASLGDSWLETVRLGGRMLDEPVELSSRAVFGWKNSESRSLAERADAASKLKDVLPAMAVAQVALDVGQDQIMQWQSMQAMSPLTQLVTAAQEPVPPVAAAANGNGAG